LLEQFPVVAPLGARQVGKTTFESRGLLGELRHRLARGPRRLGFEIQLTDTHKLIPSVRSALMHLDLERPYLVHADAHRFPLTERVEALPLRLLTTDWKAPLG
jgi:hypothetical protein